MSNLIVVGDYPAWIENNVVATLNAVNGKSKIIYRSHINQWLRWMSEQDSSAFNSPAAMLDEYKRFLQEEQEIKNSTINLKLSAIRKFFEVAVRDNLLDQSVLDQVEQVDRLPERGTKAGRWVESVDLKLLLDAPDMTTVKGLRDKAMMILLASGLRRSEVAGIRWGQIVEQSGIWYIMNVMGKGNKYRTVPIQQEYVTALKTWHDFVISLGHGGEDEYVLHNLRDGKPGLSDKSIYVLLNAYAEDVLGCKFNPHDFRRSVANYLYKRTGHNLQMVSQFLGHSGPNVTIKYLDKIIDFEEMASAMSLEEDDEVTM